MDVIRGGVYAATIPPMEEEKYYVVVSNNVRNKQLPNVLVARVTSSKKPDLPSIVSLPDGECVYGNVLCDDISEMWPDEDVRKQVGALSPPAMAKVNSALAVALGLN